jgi:Rha family phage regulatory protein
MATNNLPEITDLTIFIAQRGNELVTDSRAVALAFNKRHANVMRAINEMAASRQPLIVDHYRLHFELVDYTDAKGERRPMYRMTADGLTELAMSFTGETARLIRLRFIAAFRQVSARLESAERSITEMLHDHDKRSAVSEARARIGSKLMNERRKEKPHLKDEEARLLEITQPSLLK